MTDARGNILDKVNERTKLSDLVTPSYTEDDNLVEMLDSLSQEDLLNLYKDINLIPIEQNGKMIFPIFCESVLGKPLYDCHYRMFLFQEINSFAVIHAPIDHWKTTLANYIILYTYYVDTLLTVLYFSASDDGASRMVDFVKSEIEENKKLQAAGVRKPLNADTWSKHKIKIERPYKSNWPPSLQSHSIKANFFGKKAHRIIGDDVCDWNNSKSDTLRNELKYKFDKEAKSRLLPNGKILLLGSIVHPDDLLCKISDSALTGKSRWAYLCIKSVIDEEKKEVTFPERHPDHTTNPNAQFESLMQIKAENDLVYRMGYQNERILPDEYAIVPENVVRGCFNSSRSLRETPFPREQATTVILSIDPSVISNRKDAEKSDSSYFCAMLWYIKKNSFGTYDKYLIDLIHDRGVSEELKLNAIYNMWYIHRPNSVDFEDNAYQATIKERLTLKGIPENIIRGHTTGGDKLNPEHGIPAMRLCFERKEYNFPYKTEEDKALMDMLCEEFSQYGFVKHDDFVMTTFVMEKGLEGRPGRGVKNVDWSWGRIRSV